LIQQIPASNDAEREILAAIIRDPVVLEVVTECVSPSDFHNYQHGIVLQSMIDLYSASGTIDLIMLEQMLADGGRVPNQSVFLSEILDGRGTTSNVKHYCRIVSNKAQIRRVIAAAQTIVDNGMDGPESVSSYCEWAEGAIFDATQSAERGDRRHTAASSLVAVDGYVERLLRGEPVPGIRTGIWCLDNVINPLKDQELIIVAGRPSMGKSALMLSIALNMAMDGHRVQINSLEMSSDELMFRLLGMHSGIPVQDIKRANLPGEALERYRESAYALSGLPIHVDETSGQTPAFASSMARKMKPDIIFFDHIGIATANSGVKDEYPRVTEISSSLKGMAKDFRIPVVALSQLNRAVESRDDKRPKMADLRATGALEQDADTILFCYRPEYYAEVQGLPVRGTEIEGLAEIIVSKERNGGGSGSIVRLRFKKATTLWFDPEQRPEVWCG